MPLVDTLCPPLKTIVQPIKDMGVRVAKHLVRRIEDDGIPPQHVTLPAHLKEGEFGSHPRSGGP